MSVALDSSVDDSVKRRKEAFDADFEVSDEEREEEEFRADTHWPICVETCHHTC